MKDLHPIAKRIHNITPEPVILTLSDGTVGTFQFSWTEFFQQEFQAEGTRKEDDAAYRLISTEDYTEIMVGRQPSASDGWEMIGTIESAEPVAEDA
ncbi:transcriptional regulator [Natronocalculus amylovorans]|uniref:Transcriptional regulator n=1 Tax=Natronocalculus amylovorans TaxID=2917812 RepID=A0AAE3FW43_9EURY|nr:transcriptional regulator [Natronocalculus amylovorans]MCL9816682.1 transcriptional regulator [Natronocalculus amylovorans]NUE01125.1 transcriptional regulator [Halorubraceae archaeon YAN]